MSLSDPFQRILKITTDSHVSPLDPCQRTLKNRFTYVSFRPLPEDVKNNNRFTCVSFRPLSEDIKKQIHMCLSQSPVRGH